MNDKGSIGFSKKYWDVNYSEPEEMDGIINADRHAKYAKAFFDVDYVDISSIIDFGYGLGHLFKAFLNEFAPYRAHGIEPSEFAFYENKIGDFKKISSMKLMIENTDLVSWARNLGNEKWFDLGICTSVFQYLTDEEIEEVLPILSEQVKYLYFSVPTDIELGRQVSELEFKDEYAIHRSSTDYYQLISPYFTFLSARVLESKFHSDENKTPFTDLLFRF